MPGTFNPIPRRLAAAVGVLILATTTVGTAFAASPAMAHVQDAGKAWDRGSAATSDRVIVTFRHGTGAAERGRIARSAGLTKVRDLPGGDGVAVYRSATTVRSLRRTLAGKPAVVSVSPDVRLKRDDDPSGEPGWDQLWGLDNTGQPILGSSGSPDVDIDGLESEAITGGDPAVVVAVIDDGVDFSHPDLAARAWVNPGESGPDGLGGQKETNGVDDDGNTYTDDVHGWDFCNQDNSVHDIDQDFHGTHVSGTIAASLDGQGVVGVAPNVKIMALKFLDNGTQCGFADMAIEAIAYAKSFGIVISNNSWGGHGSLADFQPLYDAIRDSGMLFVASAGNDSIDNDTDPSPAFPASFDLPNIVSVAAADKDGGLADFSNFGHTTVDIAAPGVDILSTLPADFFLDNEPGWAYFDGTSMAAPHVTGTAALIASQDLSLLSPAKVSTIRSRLLATGKLLPLTAGETATGRMVDARRALDTVAPVPQPPNRHAFEVGSTLGATTVRTTVSWPLATDDASGVKSYDLAQQVNSGSWATVAGATTALSVNRLLTVNATSRFRVRARDRAGNVSAFVNGPTIVPRVHQENSVLATYSGTWATSANSSFSAGKTRFASKAGASVSFLFTGRAVAIVAPKGPTRGSAKVYINNVYVGTVSLYRSTTASRLIVFAKSWTVVGTRTLKVVLLGTAHRPRFDIDAFAVLR
jgi:subtilisin family serine protease